MDTYADCASMHLCTNYCGSTPSLTAYCILCGLSVLCPRDPRSRDSRCMNLTYVYLLKCYYCPPYGLQKPAMMPAKRLVLPLSGLQGLNRRHLVCSLAIRYARHRQLVDPRSQNRDRIAAGALVNGRSSETLHQPRAPAHALSIIAHRWSAV